MTLKELKNLLYGAKGKVVVVEDEKPIMVIMPYEEAMIPLEQAEEMQDGPSVIPQSKIPKGELTLDDLPL